MDSLFLYKNFNQRRNRKGESNMEQKLQLMENSIIPIYQGRAINGDYAHEQLVDARDLWEVLESKQQFANWIKTRLSQFNFVEGEDYSTVHEFIKRETGATKTIKYLFPLNVAKEIAMVENNAVGKKIRKYFIEVEKRYRQLLLERTKAKAERRTLTDIIKELVPDSPHKQWVYKHYTDLVYKNVTGYNTKELRALNNLDEKANVRNYLTPEQLKAVIRYEKIIQGLLSLGMSYEEIKSVLTERLPMIKGVQND